MDEEKQKRILIDVIDAICTLKEKGETAFREKLKELPLDSLYELRKHFDIKEGS